MVRTGIWRLLWFVPPLGIAVGLVLAVAALQTDDVILAADPCANGWDNPLARWMSCAFAIGIGVSLALMIAGAMRKDPASQLVGGLGVGFGVLAFVIGLVLASAGYGWHCPTL